RKPDFGPRQIHSTAGAMAVGARNPLIAFNVNLATEDLTVAKKIAKAVRGSSGGLQNVKALAIQLNNRHRVQVSMNLANYEATPLFRAFDLVKREAERYGVAIAGSEIVGLIPQAALNACGEFYLQIENFSEDLVLENRLHAALAESFPEIGAGLKDDAAIEDFEPPEPDGQTTPPTTEEPQARVIATGGIAAGSLTPESGSIAAYAGMLATELAVTVANMTASHKHSVEDEVRAMLERLEQLSADLQLALKEDVEGRERVYDAMALPRETEAEKLSRSMAIEQATKNAVAVPLRIAESAMQVLEILAELYEMGNAGGFSDLALSVQLAMTAIRGAAYNILPGVMNISDREFAEDCRTQITDLLESGREVADQIEDFFLRLYPSEN
ncbi:MAG: cyclodeaminase/cyclohydrolase family protein, partial [Blastocatellia bacterium]